MEELMFCCQCEQAFGGTGCIQKGVCGKSAEVAGMQDLLIYQLKGIAVYAEALLHNWQVIPKEYIAFLENALIQTLPNVNFEEQDHLRMLHTSKELKAKIKTACPEFQTERAEALFILSEERSRILRDAKMAGILYDPTINEEIRSLREAVKMGLKGIAAYSHQARILGRIDNRIDHFLCTALAALTNDSLSADDLACLILETGEKAVLAMAMLEQVNRQEQNEQVMMESDFCMNTELITRAIKNGNIRHFFLLEAVMVLTKGEVIIMNVPRWFRRISVLA